MDIDVKFPDRQAQASDRDRVWSFLNEAYQELAPYKASPRWTWQFVDNPYFQGQTEGAGKHASVWIAEDGNRVVGQMGGQAIPLRIEGEDHYGGWVVDYIVLAECRGAGVGHRVYAGGLDEFPILMILTMAGATRHIAEKAGCVTFGPVHKYSRWSRLSPTKVYRYLISRTQHRKKWQNLAKVLCKGLFFHGLFSLFANPCLAIRDSLNRSRLTSRSHELVEVDDFGPEIDELWQRAGSDYTAICTRDSKHLQWRFRQVPDMKYSAFVAKKDGQVRGYVVLRMCEPHELPQGIIADLFAAKNDKEALRDLVAHAIQFFGHEASSVECATTIDEYRDVLLEFGFRRTDTKHPTGASRDPKLMELLEKTKDDWFFTLGDHDWDQIHLA